MSVEDLLNHIRKEASYDNDDDGKPGRATGQQLHKDEVHVLGVEEWPGGKETMVTRCSRREKVKCFIPMSGGKLLHDWFPPPQSYILVRSIWIQHFRSADVLLLRVILLLPESTEFNNLSRCQTTNFNYRSLLSNWLLQVCKSPSR